MNRSITNALLDLKKSIPSKVTLVAVSKTKSNEMILEAMHAGQIIFGENKVQELVSKYEALPKSIEWHMIGHLQTNKVRFVVPFVSLIHSVDSLKLLKEINKEASKIKRVISCLLEIKIAQEEEKHGMSVEDAKSLLDSEAFFQLKHVRVVGLMGIASFTEDESIVRSEFKKLSLAYTELKSKHRLEILSMGMSGDYKIAIEEGSTMVRVGSTIFGSR